jgi:hypothetical protein
MTKEKCEGSRKMSPRSAATNKGKPHEGLKKEKKKLAFKNEEDRNRKEAVIDSRSNSHGLSISQASKLGLSIFSI